MFGWERNGRREGGKGLQRGHYPNRSVFKTCQSRPWYLIRLVEINITADMLLVKCNEFIVRIRNWRHQFQLERRIEESSFLALFYYWKNHIKEKTCQLDEFYWLFLRSLPMACFTHHKKERKNHAACVIVICRLTTNACHIGYALSMNLKFNIC